MEKPVILVVDDSALERRAILQLLKKICVERQIDIERVLILEASSPEEALARVAEHQKARPKASYLLCTDGNMGIGADGRLLHGEDLIVTMQSLVRDRLKTVIMVSTNKASRAKVVDLGGHFFLKPVTSVPEQVRFSILVGSFLLRHVSKSPID